MNKKQEQFLTKNNHLTPLNEHLKNGTILVKDSGLVDCWGDSVIYILTNDCKVQSPNQYYRKAILR